MTPTMIIESAAQGGVKLTLSATGNIKASGNSAVVAAWLPVLREHKTAIVRKLLQVDAISGDLEAIRKWLSYIGENDPRCIEEVMEQCRADAEARSYFVGRSADMPSSDTTPSPHSHGRGQDVPRRRAV